MKIFLKYNFLLLILLANQSYSQVITDIEGPVFVSLTLDDTIVDITDSSQIISFTVLAYDIISDVDYGQVEFRSPSYAHEVVSYFYSEGVNDDGLTVLSGSFEIDQGLEPGMWLGDWIVLYDLSDNDTFQTFTPNTYSFEVVKLGCIDENACNFGNIDHESCVFPEGCSFCFSGSLVLNDLDSDGICDTNVQIFEGEGFYIPDGSVVSYESFVNVTAFEPTAILDDNDFVEVCAEIEHSYLGDLDMSLTSPNGTSVSLFTQVGGATWLGNALYGDATQTTGECWNYCWSIEPEFGTFANSLGNTMPAPLGGNSMIPGSYEPLGNFSYFEGSSANGVWTLTITDNANIDNGFVCSWNISLGENIDSCIDINNDGICWAQGCTDSLAYNYNANANFDNGSCIAEVNGCTDASAFNYNSEANTEDGSCAAIIIGCTDLSALNFDPTSGANTNDGSCVPVLEGCTNSIAYNYNSSANVDDGSCNSFNQNCPYEPSFISTYSGSIYDDEIGFAIFSSSGDTVFAISSGYDIQNLNYYGVVSIVEGYSLFSEGNLAVCLDPNECYDLNLTDTYGDGWNGSYLTINDESFSLYSGGEIDLSYGNMCEEDICNFELVNYELSQESLFGASIIDLNSNEMLFTVGSGSMGEFCLNPEGCYVLQLSAGAGANYDEVVILGDQEYIYAQGEIMPQSTSINNWITTFSDIFDVGCIVSGCTDSLSYNYNDLATVNDGSCITLVYGCTDPVAINYNDLSTTDDGSCIVYGCTDALALNYYSQANIDNGNCQFNVSEENCSSLIEEEYIPLYLPLGWTMFGFVCREPLDLAEAFISIADKIIIVKDAVGSAYLPEFSFNGIGDLVYSRGYQIKTTEEILDFSFCPTLTLSENCPQREVGDIAEGGIVFYVDETGQHGLVASIEDLEGEYEWGCQGIDVSGADGQNIGSGYQNTIDIVENNCTSEIMGITAAQASLNFQVSNYDDWYLPSINELIEMYVLFGNINNTNGLFPNSVFQIGSYWSSSESQGGLGAWRVSDGASFASPVGKTNILFVRPIRAF